MFELDYLTVEKRKKARKICPRCVEYLERMDSDHELMDFIRKSEEKVERRKEFYNAAFEKNIKTSIFIGAIYIALTYF
jgi:hypothetical protein